MIQIIENEFSAIKDILYKETGVFLKPTKKTLVMTRLRKRLEELDLSRFGEYIALLKEPGSSEMEVFINALTTNETYFFRHVKQFNYLYENVLHAVVEKNKSGREIQLWTAACSTGEEPYSIAIACNEFLKNRNGCRFKLYASDINSQVIDEAKEGIYPARSLKELPGSLRTKYFRSLGNEKKKKRNSYNINDSVKKEVEFIQHNLLKPFPKKDIDIIFLRNVMIYFDKESKQKVVSNLETNLLRGGYLFISLSESLSDVRTGLKTVFSGVYQKV